MAYDKIVTVRSRLDNRIRYAVNPAKCISSETGQMLIAGINCVAENAVAEMLQTKRRWDKENGVQGYHIIHSFAPGEVTEELAQEIGVKFAWRLLGDRYEAVVSTHTDHEHIHCHILFNAVSFVDGKMYRSDFQSYYGRIRGVSNDLSREYGLSVIEPKGKGKHYAEWNAERNGKTTIRSLVRRDIDAAMRNALSLHTLFSLLEKQGYEIKRGSNIQYTAVRPPGGSSFIRLASLGPGYGEEELRRRIVFDEPPKQIGNRSFYTAKRPFRPRPRKKLRGFRALYVRYLFLLGMAPGRKYKKRISFETRKEVVRLNRYKAQFIVLQKYSIENGTQLSMLMDALQADIDVRAAQRRELYRRRRKGEDVAAEIQDITAALRTIRRELRLCRQVAEAVPILQQQLEEYRQKSQQREKAKRKTKERSADLWK